MTPTIGDQTGRGIGDEPPEQIEAGDQVDGVLEVLADPDCRAIIEATSDEALSASELTDCCDIALSTAYRKIDLLVEAGLLDERSRVTTRGRHEREFRCRVTEIRIDLSAQDGPELTLSWEGRDSASDSPHGVAVDRRLESGNGANAGM